MAFLQVVHDTVLHGIYLWGQPSQGALGCHAEIGCGFSTSFVIGGLGVALDPDYPLVNSHNYENMAQLK